MSGEVVAMADVEPAALPCKAVGMLLPESTLPDLSDLLCFKKSSTGRCKKIRPLVLSDADANPSV